MGKNRVQRKQKEKDKPKKDNIYSKKACSYNFNETGKEIEFI